MDQVHDMLYIHTWNEVIIVAWYSTPTVSLDYSIDPPTRKAHSEHTYPRNLNCLERRTLLRLRAGCRTLHSETWSDPGSNEAQSESTRLVGINWTCCFMYDGWSCFLELPTEEDGFLRFFCFVAGHSFLRRLYIRFRSALVLCLHSASRASMKMQLQLLCSALRTKTGYFRPQQLLSMYALYVVPRTGYVFSATNAVNWPLASWDSTFCFRGPHAHVD